MGGLGSGRTPKPSALKVLAGNPGHRPLNELEPKPRPVEPDMPDWLHPRAKEIWAETVREMEYMGTLASCDQGALAGYCQSFARMEQYETAIDNNGPIQESVFVSGSGEEIRVLKASPFIKMARDAKNDMRAFSTLLGLNPSARARVKATPQTSEDAAGILDAV